MTEIPKVFSTAFLMGGLGNQMFQIAHATCQGWKNGVPTIFKPIAYTPMQANQPTKYIDNIFSKINFSDFDKTTKKISYPWNFIDLGLVWDSPLEFYGYFQSSKNFFGFDNEVRNLFSPNENFIEKIEKKYPQLKNGKNVSIHIRRGDYLSIPNILPTISKGYIDYCLKQINDYNNLFVFSDDKKWVKENMNMEKIIIVEDLEDYEELWTISLCEINIMSNSSFSWWGSFLNKNIEKRVYCPDTWFGPNGEKDFRDIYVDDWIKIKTLYKNGEIICY